MPHIAITGASGFVGQHFLASVAQREDITVAALVHRSDDDNLPPIARGQWFRGDLMDTGLLAELMDAGTTLVNLAYPASWPTELHLAATNTLAQAAISRKVSRVIHCSTAVVVGHTHSAVVNESTPAHPRTAYEATKFAVEERWREHAKGNFDLAILRPTAIFGPRGKNLIKLADALTSGSAIQNYARSSLFARRPMNLISVHNVVAAIELLIERPGRLEGAVFIASEDDVPTNNFRDVETLLAKALHTPAYRLPPIALPPAALRVALRVVNPDKPDPFRIYDNSLLSSHGWKRRCTIDAALAEFAAWYSASRASPSIAS